MRHARSTILAHAGVLTLAILGWSMIAAFHADAQEKSSPAGASTTPPAASTLAVPSAEALLLLVRTTTIAIDQANKTGNYSVLRALGGPGLQAYSVAQLAKIFEPLRSSRIDLGPASKVTPELVEPPVISSEGLLILAGSFPTRPMRIQFRFVYQADDGYWKPFGLSVSMMTAAAAASATPRQPHRTRPSSP